MQITTKELKKMIKEAINEALSDKKVLFESDGDGTNKISNKTRMKLDDFHRKFKKVVSKYTTKDGAKVKIINIEPKDWGNSDLSFIDDILSEYPEFENKTFDISFIDDYGDGNFLIDDEGYCFLGYPVELYPVDERAIIRSIETVTRDIESGEN